ncbi:Arm DNA-binding domain-containing protein [Agitococcus lubricus]|uniref:Integrase n=1 Tax=Agitococcus lubricus TaxID=1077255 RepID=A0A2T5IV24_9GAMM|nr:DUF3596 domain-containing protein [Agitococcus lubricus]PTQ87679.1 integrase [Agitococcus lubricus]
MQKGVEVRGNSIRVYFWYNGELCRETLGLPATEANLEYASKLIQVIHFELSQDTFKYARHFPNSKKAKEGLFNYYIDLWSDFKKTEVAASTFKGYQDKIKAHIKPKWGNCFPQEIDHIDIQIWIKKELSLTLKNKTIKEIISIMRQIFVLYRTRNKLSYDPTEGITIRMCDEDDPDPFTRQEIETILNTPTDRKMELLLIQFMLWTGCRVSEAIALAWEDVDIERGTVNFRRSKVNGLYRVTKTKRSNREVELLKPAMDALIAMMSYSYIAKKKSFDVVQRDNRTVKKELLRPVFLNSNTGLAHETDFCIRDRFFKAHLKKAGVRYRGPGQCRHTFACQLLSTGAIPVAWISQQLGHTNPTTTFRYYAKWIRDDSGSLIKKVEKALGF